MADKDRALREATKALQRRNEMHDRARHEFRAALIRARDAGASYPEIGRAVGMSHVAVMKVVKS